MIYELRQYTLHPGKRDTLIELFERTFLETLEACGMLVDGHFRDLNDPDRFVWFRAFPDMERRREALTSFYGGPVWKANRDTANATMIDSDDVLLLRLVDPRRGFRVTQERPPVGATLPESRFALTIYSFDVPASAEDIARVRRELPTATLLQTEPAENTYPALPVRTGEHVLVALMRDDERGTLAPGARSLLR